MRALGASPIMSLGIVFLTGYPTVKLLCNAKFWLSVLAPRPLFGFARPLLLKDFFEVSSSSSSAATHKTTMARWHVPCAYKATAGS